MADCPSYDGIYDGHGPCWTCRGIPEQCPDAQRCAETSRGQRCIREDGHTGYHRVEESHHDTIYHETSVRLWGLPDQPEYPLGAIDDSEPWVVRGEEFRG